MSEVTTLWDRLPDGDILGIAGPEAATLLTITVKCSTLAGDTLTVAARGPVAGVCDSRHGFWSRLPDDTWDAPNSAAMNAHADTITVCFDAATPENEAIAVRLGAQDGTGNQPGQ